MIMAAGDRIPSRGTERVASEQASNGQPAATEGAMLFDGFHGVVGACRLKSTMSTKEGAANSLVHANATDEDRAHRATANGRSFGIQSLVGW